MTLVFRRRTQIVLLTYLLTYLLWKVNKKTALKLSNSTSLNDLQ